MTGSSSSGMLQFTEYQLPGACAFSTHVGFNICRYTGVSQPVDGDLRLLSEAVGVSVDCMVFPRQTHSANVAVVSSLPAGELEETDAVVTCLPGALVGVNTADCVPLLMVDSEAGVVAACHCGWRGILAGIAGKTLEAMRGLGARPERVHAVIGPHICGDCFEVGEDVAARFPRRALVGGYGKPHVDLSAAIALQIPGVEIGLSGLCSKELTRFYSVRRQGYGELRRTLSAITFRPKN